MQDLWTTIPAKRRTKKRRRIKLSFFKFFVIASLSILIVNLVEYGFPNLILIIILAYIFSNSTIKDLVPKKKEKMDCE